MSAGETRSPFQFSLRTFLIVSAIVGVGAGLLGRLFVHDPEMFMVVLGLLSTVAPFLLAIGTIIWTGIRGRRRRLIVWGILLLLAPLFGFGAVFVARLFLGNGPSDLRMQSTQHLIEQQLPKRIDEPWVWQELDYRLGKNQLSQPQVDDAVKALAAHITATAPKGWNRPMSWQEGFLKSAAQAGMISDSVLLSLCDAFYGLQPVIAPLPRARAGNVSFPLQIDYGSVWQSQFPVGMELLWEVNRVLLDGKPVVVQNSGKHGQQWSGSWSGPLTAGEHEVTVEVECAYIHKRKLVGLDPGSLPKDQWPQARKQWTQPVATTFKVYAVGEPIVTLTTTAEGDPGPKGGIEIDRLVAQSDQGGKSKIVLVANLAAGLSVPLSYDVAAVINGKAVNLGHLWVVSNGNSVTRGGNLSEAGVGALDPAIKAADIILTPNPSHVDDRADITEIWGKKVVLPRVPLERLDVEAKRGRLERARNGEEKKKMTGKNM